MCVRMMETDSKNAKIDYVFKNVKRGSTLRWRPPRVSTEEQEEKEAEEAFKQCRATIRKYLRRQSKGARLAKVSKGPDVVGKRRPRTASDHRHHPGSMAPENTTQYLMNNAYEDLDTDVQALAPPSHPYGESMSPSSVYAALDTDFESSLAFQQRDFEEAFCLCWPLE